MEYGYADIATLAGRSVDRDDTIIVLWHRSSSLYGQGGRTVAPGERVALFEGSVISVVPTYQRARP